MDNKLVGWENLTLRTCLHMLAKKSTHYYRIPSIVYSSLSSTLFINNQLEKKQQLAFVLTVQAPISSEGKGSKWLLKVDSGEGKGSKWALMLIPDFCACLFWSRMLWWTVTPWFLYKGLDAVNIMLNGWLLFIRHAWYSQDLIYSLDDGDRLL